MKFLGSGAINGESNAKGNEPKERKSSRWAITERTFAIIGAAASLIAVIAVVAAGIEHIPIFQQHREENLVSKLIPGDDYSRMVQIIGSLPDFHTNLRSGRQLYVFDRRWEYIQLLVDSSGTVISVGIYARITSFKATLETGIVLNGPPIDQQLHDIIVGAGGGCGGAWGDYYQGYELPLADDARSVIVGWLPVADADNQAYPPYCTAFNSGKSCMIQYYRSKTRGLSARLVQCLKSLSAWKEMQDQSPSIVIITAPAQPIVPDMLNEEYFFSLAHI